MKTGIIYIATNKITKKSYIGLSTKTLERRMKQHIRDSKRYKFKFYNALKKYGINQFEWKILYKNVPLSKLNDLEQKTVSKYDSYKHGYNSTPGGDSNPMCDSKARKRKISIANKGKVPWNKNMSSKSATNQI